MTNRDSEADVEQSMVEFLQIIVYSHVLDTVGLSRVNAD